MSGSRFLAVIMSELIAGNAGWSFKSSEKLVGDICRDVCENMYWRVTLYFGCCFKREAESLLFAGWVLFLCFSWYFIDSTPRFLRFIKLEKYCWDSVGKIWVVYFSRKISLIWLQFLNQHFSIIIWIFRFIRLRFSNKFECRHN